MIGKPVMIFAIIAGIEKTEQMKFMNIYVCVSRERFSSFPKNFLNFSNT